MVVVLVETECSFNLVYSLAHFYIDYSHLKLIRNV